MQFDQKNLVVAIVLSIAIVLGFEFLYNLPRLEKQRALQAEQAQSQTVAPSATPTPPAAPGVAPVTQTPAAGTPVVSPRIKIDAARIDGSIRLVGGRIDDIRLKDYRETVDPNSPSIVLLAPQGSPEPYFAEFGWTPTPGAPTSDTLWTADRQTLTSDQPVTLSWDNGQGLRFERRFAIDANFMLQITDRVVNTGSVPVQLSPYGRVQREGTPHTSGYYILHEGPLGVFNGTLTEYNYDKLKDKKGIEVESTGGWIGITDKYWLVALVPDQARKIKARFIHPPDTIDRYQVDYTESTETVAPGGTLEVTNRLFAGAKEVKLLDRYTKELGISRFDLAVDWGWFWFLTKPIFIALDYFATLLGNFGLAILLLTVLIKAAFFPLANKSYRAMSKMKLLQPEMEALRAKYGEDRQRMSTEMMALYKKHGANPVSGCLPIALQIPVFFALYKTLFVTIEMRHAPFYGWIRDLSAPDPTSVFNLFGLFPWAPPEVHLLGHTLGAWPLIMGVTMFMQQKLNPQPPDPIQAKIFLLMPIFFTFLLASFPAGLVIYWAWNNVLSVAQQWLIMRSMGVNKSTIHPPVPAKTAK
jgi:YidC/Oxa1 family membrane protein insertase